MLLLLNGLLLLLREFKNHNIYKPIILKEFMFKAKRKQAKKLILIGYRHPSIKTYTPKKNKLKLGLLGLVSIVCLVTPFTNWFLFVVGSVLNKFPLWVFR